jgi:hypothetical protein
VVQVRFINNPASLNLEGFRAMKTITLGPYWIPAPAHNTFSIRQQAFNYRRGEPQILLVSRTQPLSDEDAENFRDVMISGTHTITENEWKQLGAVVGEQADHGVFVLKNSEVLDWNGKLCILNEGEWADFNLKTYNLFFDGDGNGRFVEEVIYQAPIMQFNEYLQEAMLAMQSIDWHKLDRF